MRTAAPQATLARIRTVVRAITSRAHDAKRVAAESGTPYRHALYALAAARTLGLVTGAADRLKLTALGHELAQTPSNSRAEAVVLRHAIEMSPLIRKIAPGLLGTHPPTTNDIASRIHKFGNSSPSTARQRARMIYKWRDLLKPHQETIGLATRTQPERGPGRMTAPTKEIGPPEERIQISGGSLGPIPPCDLTIRPFTVLVGPQGTGKSLLAQVLYFFRALPELIPAAVATIPRREAKDLSNESLVRNLLDGLRSPERAFAGFAVDSATVRWTPEGESERTLGFGAYSRNRRIRPDRQLNKYVSELITHFREIDSRAIFIPTERLFYSQVRSPLATQILSLPSTYTWFSEWMQRATSVFEGWRDGRPDTPRGRWVRERARSALRGEAVRWRDTWKWRFPRGREEGTLDLDMASSGQRATWPIVLLAETLFSMRKRGRLNEAFALYVEEPEIHLHPEAQVAVVEILAYLVNSGFRVVVTTHSLPVLYALNNLVLAGGLGSKRPADGRLPPAVAALKRAQVAAYAFGDGKPKDLVDADSGFISEVELGRVTEQLNDTLNRMSNVLFSPEEATPK